MGSKVRAFYDTVVFLLSLNKKDDDHCPCSQLVDPLKIKWVIGFSVISRAESTISEYLETLLTVYANNGIDWVEVEEEEIKIAIKRKRAIFSSIERLGVPSRDRRQVFAALSMNSSLVITRDRDYLDPKLKTLKRTKNKSGEVSRIIEKDLSIQVMYPLEAIQFLTKVV